MNRNLSSGADGNLQWIENAAPTGRWPALRLGDIWRHRELAGFFALRDFKVRYKQAFLGLAWAGLQPLVGAFTFTLLFNRLANIDVGGRSYFAFALVGFSVWTYFSSTLSTGSTSLLNNSDLLTKVAFPRLVAPTATLVPGLIDLAVGSAMAVVVALIVGDRLSLVGIVVGLPLGVALLITSVAGPVFFFSAAIVKYRDASVIVGFAVQILLFASPVAYPPELVPDPWRSVLYLNPIAGALGLLRSGLVGSALPSIGDLALSAVAATVFLLGGLFHFRRNELEFADII